MPAYRLFRVSRFGRVVSATEIDCGLDREAILAAAALDDGRTMELWDGARVVKVFNPAPPAAGARRPIVPSAGP